MKKFNILFFIGLFFSLGCVQMKEQALFDAPPKTPVPDNIGGFYGLEIMQDELNGDFWGEENPECLKVERVVTEGQVGEFALRVTWDKDKGVCDWIGMGWGWNGWMSKDMKNIIDSAALSFKVKPVKGVFGNLPIAVGIEDYSGAGAWLGFSPNAVNKEKSSNGWTQIEMPLSEFNWAEQQTNPSNIKQVIIQLEAIGDFYFDDIKIAPRVGGFDYRVNVPLHDNLTKNVDGKMDEPFWSNAGVINLNGQSVKMVATKEGFIFGATVKDNTPAINENKPTELWNGDALEFCIRTDPRANVGRSRISTLDRQLIVGLSDNKSGWMVTQSKPLENYNYAIKRASNNYTFELFIPFVEFGLQNPEKRLIYPFDFALDFGDNTNRTQQLRWNSQNNPNFYQLPSIWGELVFVEPSITKAQIEVKPVNKN